MQKNIIETMTVCVSKNKKQVEKISSSLKEMREKINKTLDSLEDATNGRAISLAKKGAITINETTDTLNAMVNLFTEYKALMEKMETYGSLSHRYIIAKRLEELIRDLEVVISDIARNVKGTNLSLKLETMLQNILNLEINDVPSLASIEEMPYDISLPPYEGTVLKAKKATAKSIQENYDCSHSPTYSCITFLPNRCFALIDTWTGAGYCLLANSAGKFVSSCDFQSSGGNENNKPSGVTFVKNNIFAVSLPGLKKICFVSTDYQFNIINEIATTYEPKAIQGLKTGDMAVAWSNPVAFGIISVDEEQREKVYFSKDKSGRELKCFEYMAVDEKRSHVIQPCSKDDAIYCFDLEGTPKFKYTDTKCSSPRGVAVDRNGNIYVCSWFPHVIHAISPTGVAIQIIEEGVPIYPLAIAFRKDGEEFAVTQGNDYRVVTFFSLQHA